MICQAEERWFESEIDHFKVSLKGLNLVCYQALSSCAAITYEDLSEYVAPVSQTSLG